MKYIEKNTLQIHGINLQLRKGGARMNLKQLREESSIKAYKVAERLDISRVKFNNIEKRNYNLEMLKIEKLNEIYGKSIQEIEIHARWQDVNQEEILFNKLHDIFKNNISNKRTLTVIECAELINVNKEKIRELINKPNTDFPYFKVGAKVLINKEMLHEWLEKISLEHRQIWKIYLLIETTANRVKS